LKNTQKSRQLTQSVVASVISQERQLNFDKEEFEITLYEESKKAFQKIIEEQIGDIIYSLSLYNSGDEWCYLFPTVATEKGLDEVAKKYKEKEYYKNKSISCLKNDLKWSPCDSPIHENYVDDLPKTEKLLAPLPDLMYKLYEEGKEKESDQLHNDLVETTLRVLNKLQTDGIFNSLDRSSFTLNFLNGDQSNEERLERAKILNPSNVYREYESEI
jgi:hypothetical protein